MWDLFRIFKAEGLFAVLALRSQRLLLGETGRPKSRLMRGSMYRFCAFYGELVRYSRIRHGLRWITFPFGKALTNETKSCPDGQLFPFL